MCAREAMIPVQSHSVTLHASYTLLMPRGRAIDHRKGGALAFICTQAGPAPHTASLRHQLLLALLLALAASPWRQAASRDPAADPHCWFDSLPA